MGDDSKSIFLSTVGENSEEIPKEVEEFLTFVREDTPTSNADSKNPYIKQIQDTIRNIKKNREMERQYMLLEDLLGEERKAAELKGELKAKRNAVLELLEDFGWIPESIDERIMSEEGMDTLKAMLKAAAKAESLEQFEELISNL